MWVKHKNKSCGAPAGEVQRSREDSLPAGSSGALPGRLSELRGTSWGDLARCPAEGKAQASRRSYPEAEFGFEKPKEMD